MPDRLFPRLIIFCPFFSIVIFHDMVMTKQRQLCHILKDLSMIDIIITIPLMKWTCSPNYINSPFDKLCLSRVTIATKLSVTDYSGGAGLWERLQQLGGQPHPDHLHRLLVGDLEDELPPSLPVLHRDSLGLWNRIYTENAQLLLAIQLAQVNFQQFGLQWITPSEAQRLIWVQMIKIVLPAFDLGDLESRLG